MAAMSMRATVAEETLMRLMKRCVECPNVNPSCPATCAQGQTCTLRPQSCSACARMECVQVSTIPGQQAETSSATPIGGIIGGVVGGVVVICAITYLVWRSCLRTRRHRETWIQPEKSSVESAGAQLRTRPHSIASTVQTRGSNLIKIAYIPGVTVRSAPDTPEVPAVPSSYGGTSVESTPHLEQHFFMPSRDSTWSDATSISENRMSLTPSLARASVATTIYRNEAVVPPIPAQYATPSQANVVNLRSGSSTPNPGRASPNQRSDKLQPSQIVARNVTARPVEIRRHGSVSQTVPTMANLAAAGKDSSKTRKVAMPSVSDEKEVVISPTTTLFEESPTSPLAKPKATFVGSDAGSASNISTILPTDTSLRSGSISSQNASNTTTADISAMILNAMKSATQDAAHRPGMTKHDSGPFSDDNEIRDNRSRTP